MDLAMRLLKKEDSVCPHCRGTGKDPNQKGIPEEGIAPGECEPCDGSGMHWVQTPLDERGFPIESYEEDDPNWQDSIETGEPMDLAYDAIRKNLNRWFKEKWVDVSRKDKDGKHPPCGRSKAKKGSKGYPKCRPSVKVSSKTPKTSGSMSEGQKRAATKRKRSKKQGVGGKPTIVKMVRVI